MLLHPNHTKTVGVKGQRGEGTSIYHEVFGQPRGRALAFPQDLDEKGGSVEESQRGPKSVHPGPAR